MRSKIFRRLQESGRLETLTMEEIEEGLGIQRSHKDYPDNRHCCGPRSDYYSQYTIGFRTMHKAATKALAWLKKYLSKPSIASEHHPQQN